ISFCLTGRFLPMAYLNLGGTGTMLIAIGCGRSCITRILDCFLRRLAMTALDSLQPVSHLQLGISSYRYYALPIAAAGLGDIQQLPVSLKVLLENLLRHEDGETVTRDDIQAMADWLRERRSDREIQFRPARVLMQDFTGVPAVVDLAAMRDAMARAGG